MTTPAPAGRTTQDATTTEVVGPRASTPRRLIALALDWALSLAVSAGFFALNPWATLAVFAVENVMLISMLGYTIGQRVVSIRVCGPLGDRPPNPGRVLIRTVLLCLVIPAVVWDSSGRGMHDRAAGTWIVRSASA